jgi:hypothetical protein
LFYEASKFWYLIFSIFLDCKILFGTYFMRF